MLINVLVGACLAGVACSLLGVFVVRMKLSSVGFCMSHAAFAGSALGIALSLNPLILAMVFSCTIAFIIGPMAEKSKLHPDVILGVLFSLTLSLGLIFLKFTPGTALSSRAMGVLWGSILGIGTKDIIVLGILTFVILAFMILFSKELRSIMFNRKMAEASGINTRVFYYLILFLTAGVISLSLKLIGGLLIFALIINPAATAYEFSYDIRKIIIFSPLLGAGYCFLGIGVSFLFDFPIGASIGIISALCFGISVILSPKRRKG